MALFNLDASLDELKLRHRDLTTLEVSKSGSGMGAMSPTGYTCAINDAGKLVVSSASGDFGFAQSADKYEVLNNGAAPSAASVTAGTTIAITKLGTRGSVQLRLTLMDGAGLNTKTTISDAILTLMPPVVIDKVKTDNGELSDRHDPKNFLEYGTNKGQVEIQVPTQAYYYSGITADQSDKKDVSGVTIKYALKESSSSTTPDTQSSTTTEQLDFTTEGAYELEVWAEKPGYESSSKSTYQIALQKTVYVSPSGDDNNNLGFTATPVKTVAKAIEIINNAKVQNDWTIRIWGSVESGGVTVGNDLTAKSLVIQGDNSNSDIITGKAGEVVLALHKANTTVKNLKITGGAHGVKIDNNQADVTLESCLITDNDATNDTSSNGGNQLGGGLWLVSGNCTIKGTTISNNKANQDGCQVSVRTNGKLTMESGTISGVTDTSFDFTGKNSKKGGGVYVTGGTFTMKGGTIQNCKAYWGGGVYITGNTGKFNMSGGTIQSCEAKNGGGVYVTTNNSSVFENFVMSGNATIKGNTAGDAAGSGYGGGVYVAGSSSKFTMKDSAVISGNTINCRAGYRPSGAGVYVHSSIFNMEGGTIGGTTAEDANKCVDGGGVYIVGAIFNMTGGSITGNQAGYLASGVTPSGGGVYAKNTTFNMIDGTISNNKVGYEDNGNFKLSGNAGGVFIFGATFNMSGGTISGNQASDGGGLTVLVSNVSDSNAKVYIHGNAVIGATGIASTATSAAHSNKASSKGGAIYIEQDNTEEHTADVYIGYKPPTSTSDAPILDNSATPTIAYNYAGMHGGGIYLASGSLTLGKGSVSYNCAAENTDTGGGYGGGINAQGTFTMNGGTISNNNAAYDGGGLDIGTTCIFFSTSGTIESNTAKNGGGIAVFTSTEAGQQSSHTITGLTIKKNTATEKGGGIFVNGGSTLTASSCTIIQNHAGNHGGGVSHGSGATFTNTDNSCTINGNTRGTSNETSETEN